MEGRFLVKGNKDETITKNSSNGEENVECWKCNGLLFQLTYPNRGALPALKKKKFVCEPLPVIFVVSIIVVSTLLQVILKLVTTRNILS